MEDDIDIEKADEFLRMAELAFENGAYNTCANRAYYAMFRITFVAFRRFLRKDMIPKETSHRGAMSTFRRELVNRRKIFRRQMAEYLEEGFEARCNADYGDSHISKKVAKRRLDKTKAFVATVREVVIK